VNVCRIDPGLPLGIHEPKMAGDVGFDLVAMEAVEIPAGEARDVPVNARIELPHGVWAEIRGRSSIARLGLAVDAGTIDNGYRGPLYVLVRNMKPCNNNGPNVTHIQAGQRIGQLVLHQMVQWQRYLQEVPNVEQDTERGARGFGSTGL
jgi:dUTP pyrophosphatase